MKKIIKLLMFFLFLGLGVFFDLAPINVPDGIDKIYHFIGFSLMTMLAISTFSSFFSKKWLNLFLMFLLVFGGMFAGIAEYLQTFVPLRTCSVDDWITNLCGITFVVIFVFLNNSKEEKVIELNEGQFELEDL
jgi:VanZ family protein